MKRYGLIGFPLTHSFSADYFARKFVCEGIVDCEYIPFELPSVEELPALLRAEPSLLGFNVTAPYKQLIISYLDRLSPEADRVGAVNCVRRDPTAKGRFGVGRLIGYNTDIEAFKESLCEFLGKNDVDSALVLGTGGAARAVCEALAQLGIPCRMVSRKTERGNLTYDQVTLDIIARNNLIINATPVGTWPHSGEVPLLAYEGLTPEHMLFDLVYNPPMTRFLALGAERGARVCNGLDMLHKQAEASWKLWVR